MNIKIFIETKIYSFNCEKPSCVIKESFGIENEACGFDCQFVFLLKNIKNKEN